LHLVDALCNELNGLLLGDLAAAGAGVNVELDDAQHGTPDRDGTIMWTA